MASITTINSGDLITNSRADLNNNFANLNSDKIETSTLDTDTTLSANSDSKIATQKAVKAYVDSGGSTTVPADFVNTSAGVADAGKGIILDGNGLIDGSFVKVPTTQYIGTGGPGEVVNSQFDITNPAGTTFRYTYDGTGTDPGITASSFPVDSVVIIQGSQFTAANTGNFTITASDTDYFEIDNASGVTEVNVDAESLYVYDPVWTKPTGLSYALIEVVGGGGAGSSGDGGGGGGYSKKILGADDLAATETVTAIGVGGTSGGNGGDSTFAVSGGTDIVGLGGIGANSGSAGGSGTGGDITIVGGDGSEGESHSAPSTSSTVYIGGQGGSSQLGQGGAGATGSGSPGSWAADAVGTKGNSYGGGGGNGASGTTGVIIVTEYYA